MFKNGGTGRRLADGAGEERVGSSGIDQSLRIMGHTVCFHLDGQYPLTDAQYAFTLDPYANGTPAPTLVTKEVDMAVAAPFLLVNPDFSKTEVTKAYVFNPSMSDSEILLPRTCSGLKIRLHSLQLIPFLVFDCPEIRAEIQVMKTKVMKYQTLADSIKSFEERKDSKGKDTFDLSDWWKSNCATLSGFAYVLRAVLTNSPNSYPSDKLTQFLPSG